MSKNKTNTDLRIERTWEAEEVGWDIPTRILLDSNDCIWMDSAHGSNGFEGKSCVGHYLTFLSKYESDSAYEHVCSDLRILFKLKPKLPEWIRMAIKYGWTPPANFNKDDYEI